MMLPETEPQTLTFVTIWAMLVYGWIVGYAFAFIWWHLSMLLWPVGIIKKYIGNLFCLACVVLAGGQI